MKIKERFLCLLLVLALGLCCSGCTPREEETEASAPQSEAVPSVSEEDAITTVDDMVRYAGYTAFERLSGLLPPGEGAPAREVVWVLAHDGNTQLNEVTGRYIEENDETGSVVYYSARREISVADFLRGTGGFGSLTLSRENRPYRVAEKVENAPIARAVAQAQGINPNELFFALAHEKDNEGKEARLFTVMLETPTERYEYRVEVENADTPEAAAEKILNGETLKLTETGRKTYGTVFLDSSASNAQRPE